MMLELCGKRYALQIGFYDSGRLKLELEDGSKRLEITGEGNHSIPSHSALILKNDFNLEVIGELQQRGVIVWLSSERVYLSRGFLLARMNFDRLYGYDPNGLIRYLEHFGEWEKADFYRNLPRHIVTVFHEGYECLSLTLQKPTPFKELAEALGTTEVRLGELIDEGAGQMGVHVWRLKKGADILIGFSFHQDARTMADYIMLRLGILKSYQILCEWTMTGYSEQTAFRLEDAIDAAKVKGPPADGKIAEGTFNVASHLADFGEAVSFGCPQCGSCREAPGYYHSLHCPDCGGIAVRTDMDRGCVNMAAAAPDSHVRVGEMKEMEE